MEKYARQALAEFTLQVRRQREGVFHRIQLDEPRARLHGVGVHGLNVLADGVLDAVWEIGQEGGIDHARESSISGPK